MQRISYIFCCLFLLLVGGSLSAQEDFRKSAPDPGPAPQINLGDFKDFKLPNGLHVIVVENHKLPRVSVQLYVDVPLHTEGDEAGLSGLAGSLLRNGTEQRTKAEIDEAIDFIGANLSTNANGMFGSTITKHRETLLKIMSEVLLQPSFPEDEFTKLKRQSASGLAQAKNNPNAIAGRVVNVLRYGADHPYGELTTEETLENISTEDARAYYEKYFQPNRSYLVLVGDLQFAEARRLAETYFGSWEKGEVSETDFAVPSKPRSRQVSFVARPGAVQSVVHITYPVNLKPGSKDAIQAGLLTNIILGSSFNGRLFKNLREDKGYTYGATSRVSSDPYVGYFDASASVRNEVTDSAVTQFLYELDRVGIEKISEDELALGKAQIMGSFARALESPQQIAQYALNTVRYKLPRDFYPNYLKVVEATTANDLMVMAQEYITPNRAHILVVGDKAVADKLAQFDADGEVQFLDESGNAVDMSTSAAPSDLTPQNVLDRYIAAIGGQEELESVEDVSMTMNASVQGMSMGMTRKQKSGKLLQTMTMNGQPAGETRFDGEQAVIKQMGQTVPVDDDMLADLREQAVLFPQLDYSDRELKLAGTETLEGKKAYVLEVTDAEGNTTTEYYDAETGLLIPFDAKGDGNADPRDPDAYARDLAAGINRLMAVPEKRRAMGRAARKRVEALFSWTSIARQTLDYYAHVSGARDGFADRAGK